MPKLGNRTVEPRRTIVLGLDIGGANLKAATTAGRAISVPFPLWKQPDELPASLAALVAEFPEIDELAVTMTGELCDCYATKREGVNRILDAVEFAAASIRTPVPNSTGVPPVLAGVSPVLGNAGVSPVPAGVPPILGSAGVPPILGSAGVPPILGSAGVPPVGPVQHDVDSISQVYRRDAGVTQDRRDADQDRRDAGRNRRDADQDRRDADQDRRDADQDRGNASQERRPSGRLPIQHETITRRRLPHIQIPQHTYHVIFRTADSQLAAAARQIAFDACLFWHGKKATVHACVVMPDHVHLLLTPAELDDGSCVNLSEILHSIKSYSAHRINKLLKCQGSCWQRESYHRFMRSDDDFHEKLEYIRNNPASAGLADYWHDYPFLFIENETNPAGVPPVPAGVSLVLGSAGVPPVLAAVRPVLGSAGVPPVPDGVSPVGLVQQQVDSISQVYRRDAGVTQERRDAEQERRDAEQERRDADQDRRDAGVTQERRDAEQERRETDQDRRDAEQERRDAEQDRWDADQDRRDAGGTQDRRDADQDRRDADQDRRDADQDRRHAGVLRVRVWSTAGEWLFIPEARVQTLAVAASNWHALATFAGRFAPQGNGLLIDMGSSTTDIIPLSNGWPQTLGQTDAERLLSGELVYLGVKRTPIMALGLPNVCSEYFADMRDVHIVLGQAFEEPESNDTADGRPATLEYCLDRLARMFGADRETASVDCIIEFAIRCFQQQREKLVRGIHRVDVTDVRTLIVSGAGEWLARDAWTAAYPELNPRIVSLNEELGTQISACAPAYAVAVLATEMPI